MDSTSLSIQLVPLIRCIAESTLLTWSSLYLILVAKKFINSNQKRPQWVMAIGRPFTLTHQLSSLFPLLFHNLLLLCTREQNTSSERLYIYSSIWKFFFRVSKKNPGNPLKVYGVPSFGWSWMAELFLVPHKDSKWNHDGEPARLPLSPPQMVPPLRNRKAKKC